MFCCLSSSISEDQRKPGRVVLVLAALTLCVCATSLEALAQIAPKATDKVPASKPAIAPPRVRRPRVSRPATTVNTRGSAQVDSDNFVDLGDRFTEKGKWNAAEVAYTEATRIWPGNVDALVALGFLYVDKGTLSEAYGIYNRLRSMNSASADDLMGEIRKRESSK